MFILFVCSFVQEVDYSMSYVHHDALLIHEHQPNPSRRSLSFSNRMSYHERHLFEVKCLHDIRMHITLYKYDTYIRASLQTAASMGLPADPPQPCRKWQHFPRGPPQARLHLRAFLLRFSTSAHLPFASNGSIHIAVCLLCGIWASFQTAACCRLAMLSVMGVLQAIGYDYTSIKLF